MRLITNDCRKERPMKSAVFIFIAAVLPLVSGCGAARVSSAPPPPAQIEKKTPPLGVAYAFARLNSPSQIQKHAGKYFIVDIWNSRILVSGDLYAAVSQWHTLDAGLVGPHSAAFLEDLMVVDNTEADSVQVWRAGSSGGYELAQTINGIPRRPHFVLWDDDTRAFWALGSRNQTVYKFSPTGDNNAPLQFDYSRRPGFFGGRYVKSMHIHGGLMYFAATGRIFAAEYKDGNFNLADSFPAPAEATWGGGELNGVFYIDGWWYITGRPGAIARTRSLETLKRGGYENLSGVLQLPRGSEPYYMSEFDGRIWLAFVRNSGILSFRHGADGKIEDVQILHYEGGATVEDKRRKMQTFHGG